MLPVTIKDVKFILECEMARKRASGCYDSAAAIELALTSAMQYWDDNGYNDDFEIIKWKKEGAEECLD